MLDVAHLSLNTCIYNIYFLATQCIYQHSDHTRIHDSTNSCGGVVSRANRRARTPNGVTFTFILMSNLVVKYIEDGEQQTFKVKHVLEARLF